MMGHLRKNKQVYVAVAYGLVILFIPVSIFATSSLLTGSDLILLQKASFWLGIGTTAFGVKLALD